MSCNSCSSDIQTKPNGCKSNGGCSSGGCEKLSVFDWLANMTLPTGQKPFDIMEVRFKNGRKHFFKNVNNLSLAMGDVIAVEGSPGHDIGSVSLTGELVKVQMNKKKVAIDDEELIKKIYRKATQKDIDIWTRSKEKEVETQKRGREIILRLGLKMKLSDIEYQGDGNKATFYYTADERVDFRQLIRDLASSFNIRVEMKQVGLRQEAARLGGIGSCGRELCCSTWLTDLRKVNTAAARYQQLSLNPQKLAGQCGKLKCCLNYELDTYVDALSKFPKPDVMLNTEKGKAVFIKMDIFKEYLWYTYKDDRSKWFKLNLEQVNEIIALNKEDEKVASLEEFDAENTVVQTKVDFENVVGQDSLTRFDTPKRARNKRNNKNKNKNKKQQGNSKANNNNNNNQRKNTPQKNGEQPGKKTINTGNNPPQRRKKKPQNNQVQGGGNTPQKNGQGNTPKKKPQQGDKPQNKKPQEGDSKDPKAPNKQGNKARNKRRNNKNNKPKPSQNNESKPVKND
ncbi:MAG: hypothetical protein COB98_03935 [Flavobacteriaceae bacterium]|nr:MAG: hypothetical protein COB98_03935 [Flavobacteriaceae bacterium]